MYCDFSGSGGGLGDEYAQLLIFKQMHGCLNFFSSEILIHSIIHSLQKTFWLIEYGIRKIFPGSSLWHYFWNISKQIYKLEWILQLNISTSTKYTVQFSECPLEYRNFIILLLSKGKGYLMLALKHASIWQQTYSWKSLF